MTGQGHCPVHWGRAGRQVKDRQRQACSKMDVRTKPEGEETEGLGEGEGGGRKVVAGWGWAQGAPDSGAFSSSICLADKYSTAGLFFLN